MRTTRVSVLALLVLASGLVASHATSAVLACGAEVRSSVTLTADVGSSTAPCTDDGLRVTKSGVTVDLGGHTIWGTRVGFVGDANDGVELAAEVKNVTIRNGAIRGADTGVNATLMNHGTTMSNLVAAATQIGFYAVQSKRVTVERSVATGSESSGIFVAASSAATVHRNVVWDAAGTGIAVHDIDGLTVTGNVVSAGSPGPPGSGEGISISNSAGAEVARNVVSRTRDTGINVTHRATISKNLALSTGGTGFEIGGESSRVNANRSIGNAAGGFILSAGKMVVEKNVATGNTGTGIHAFGQGIQLLGNRTDGNDSHGVHILGSQARIDRNRSTGNGGTGIRISTGGSVTNNVVTGNGFGVGTADGSGAGIDANGATLTGFSNNLARANDERECPATEGLCRHPRTDLEESPAPACGEIVTGSIKLAGDVGSQAVPCTGHGIVVGAPNVTIDLNGHTVWGNTAGGFDSGILPGPHRGVRVLGGRIRGFDIGLKQSDAAGDARQRIDDVVVAGSTAIAIQITGKGSAVVGSAAVATQGLANDYGIIVNSGATMKDSVTIANGGNGAPGARGPMSGNVARLNGGTGFTTARRATGNVAVRNAGDGFEVTGVEVPLSRNIAVRNGNDGFDVWFGKKSTLSGNVSTGNGGNGLNIQTPGVIARGNVFAANLRGVAVAAEKATLTRNKVLSSTTHGVVVTGDRASILSNAIHGGIIDGVNVTAAKVTIIGNDVRGVGHNGIRILGATAGKVDGNRAVGDGFRQADTDEAGLGISAPSATVTGRNKAFGNDDDAQCDPATLC